MDKNFSPHLRDKTWECPGDEASFVAGTYLPSDSRQPTVTVHA